MAATWGSIWIKPTAHMYLIGGWARDSEYMADGPRISSIEDWGAPGGLIGGCESDSSYDTASAGQSLGTSGAAAP